ncbi:MAG: hypothetical protein K8R86_03610 [Bacteroidales bacterium]|nr:hypothetical protein [Bacteroidales bacterium]
MNPKKVNKTETLSFGKYYHIYNHAVGDEKLFKTPKDYFYFLEKLKQYILPVANVYAYSLLPNHFHLLIKTLEQPLTTNSDEKSKLLVTEEKFHLAFKNLFISYSKSFNKVHRRMGRLFIQPYKRILVEKESYLLSLICYIHRNPIHHGYVDNYKQWGYSSFNLFLNSEPTFIQKDEVLEYFGGIENFITFHEENKTIQGSKKYFIE